MRKFWQEILVAVVAGLIIPMMIVSFFSRRLKRPEDEPVIPETTGETVERADKSVSVVMQDGVRKMELDEYLVGVVLAEMPAEFETDALKAQAVVARTYTLKRMETASKHPDGDVCTNPSCCQAYLSEKEFLARGESEDMLGKVKSAVYETREQVLLYNDNYIEATYFSCSGGRTEDAVAVWGSEIPYLKAVDSPGEEGASHYIETVTFSAQEVASRLGISSKTLQIGRVSYTAGGGVDTITISGTEFKGTEIRSKLSLRSTAFAMTVIGDSVTITTKGFGHRVGMSQYGAQAMAQAGSDYETILAYYYQGTTLSSYLSH